MSTLTSGRLTGVGVHPYNQDGRSRGQNGHPQVFIESCAMSELTWLVQEAEEGFCRGRESGIFASDNTKLPLDLEVADRHDAEPPILRLRRHRQA